MITYQLFRYNTGDDEEVVFEHGDEQTVVDYALKSSYQDKGYYTYRLEKLISSERTFVGFRFFQNGEEFTHKIIGMINEYI